MSVDYVNVVIEAPLTPHGKIENRAWGPTNHLLCHLIQFKSDTHLLACH